MGPMQRYQYHRFHNYIQLRLSHVTSWSLSSCPEPNCLALVNTLRASTDLTYFQQLHCYSLRSGHFSDGLVSVAVVRLYVGAGHFSDAHKVLVEIPHPNVDAWNSMINSYARSGQFRKALAEFLRLDSSETRPNSYSITAVLPACGGLRLLRLGRSVHSKIVQLGFESTTIVLNCLVDMYGKCGSIEDAISAFERIVEKDVVSWNSVIGASARNGSLREAVTFLKKMPNPDAISYNALINGFSTFGKIEEAMKILSIMPKPNSSSWNSVITGCVNRDRAREALEIFSKMYTESVGMDKFTFSSILSGIARLSALTWGSLVHCITVKISLDLSTVVGSALVDMYSKCGRVIDAESIFQSMPYKNLVTWNAMLSGFAHNGNASRVIELFEKLHTQNGGLKPDDITFLNVLSACSHNVMPLEAALGYFKLMVTGYKIEPTVDHYCCLIRLMGNIGELRKAQRFILEAGLGASALAWKTLLGACEGQRALKIAEAAAARVVELEGNTGYAYNVISNMYASYGTWEKVAGVRELMKKTGVTKLTSYSWIEVDDIEDNTYK